MRKLVTTLSVAAAAFLATPASAAVVQFTGTTTGCFGAGCTPGAYVPLGTAVNGGLIYTNGQFNQATDPTGFLGIGGSFDNLGSFTLAPLVDSYTGDIFRLLVSFTAPPGTVPGSTTLQALLTGSVQSLNNGSVFIDFDNTPQSFTYNGGSFTFAVNDVSVSASGIAQILSGQIQAVPEPATWGMMLLGFAGIGMALRRRRSPALAQIA